MSNIQQLHKVSEQEGQQSKSFAIYFNKDTAGTYVLWLGNTPSGSLVQYPMRNIGKPMIMGNLT